MAIWLHINIRSGVPIYVQLIEQIQHALEVGTLSPGDGLPSVRELASELSIAPNTIAKAYNELQRMGLIESRAGKGTIVLGEVEETIRTRQQEALIERLQAIVHDASKLGMSAETLQSHFEYAVQQFFPELQRPGDKK
ncbi:GntR family transcriptional regulator [Reticulibacter mediterranei]|uniref:GntR family transcriptional regulator n=1 Tax=Reticulibacter mediterranei TaxID=2778369 RepID=A0A8J3ISD0_9CHLR|nr:GntR family transcriptional regulator [Reticulibacter mediterranei]GHO97640.1 GntR family transcriptional regulator [Reticulibacter mediterranei]